MCPVSFNYVLTVPWNSSTCLNFQPFPSQNQTHTSLCCQTLLSLFGIALAQNLKKNSLFHLPNLPTSISCLQNFQTKLNSLSLPNNLLSSCFDPLQFVITPNICAHIQSKQDWLKRVGPAPLLNTACKPDLSVLANCGACTDEGLKVLQILTAIDGNTSHSKDCFYFTILYIVGVVNEFGPESKGAMSCILELPVNSERKNSGNLLVNADPQEERSILRLRPNTGSIWFKFEDLEKATNKFSPQNLIGRGGFGSVFKGILHDGTMVAVKRIEESDFQGDAEFYNEVEIISNLKHRNLVPLRGCCVVDEDDNHEYRRRYIVHDYMLNGTPTFLTTDWVWSLMKSGNLEEALDASILIDGNSNRNMMERFLLVGILSSHVMVGSRPTILDALKMLEGDIEVPPIPDRPMTLGHYMFSSEG
ncbi:Serine-threonine/tyrosine-protein kinase, catalytic domain [Sesbania bispinosa]|nr:Serine-threonine/tyrosine-protein kinase, catalytic domain [Sesbania bispinosa]